MTGWCCVGASFVKLSSPSTRTRRSWDEMGMQVRAGQGRAGYEKSEENQGQGHTQPNNLTPPHKSTSNHPTPLRPSLLIHSHAGGWMAQRRALVVYRTDLPFSRPHSHSLFILLTPSSLLSSYLPSPLFIPLDTAIIEGKNKEELL